MDQLVDLIKFLATGYFAFIVGVIVLALLVGLAVVVTVWLAERKDSREMPYHRAPHSYRPILENLDMCEICGLSRYNHEPKENK